MNGVQGWGNPGSLNAISPLHNYSSKCLEELGPGCRFYCLNFKVFDVDTAVLIDAYSQIFRSFYAIRYLTDPTGRPVNALYVFTKLLLGIEKEYPGDRGAMLFDCGKVKFRLEVAPEYKSNRPPMPDDLKSQMPAIREMAQAFGWQLLSAENYEADDLIGGFANAFPGKVMIVTSDKDLSQLINDRISILAPAKGNSGGFMLRGERDVIEKFGVKPDLVADYLALVGDTSDNIPGVPGIGPKSAAAILNKIGPIDSWIDDPSKLESSKFAAKLAGHQELLRKNQMLVRLKTELPEDFNDLEKTLSRQTPDWQKIASICREYSFNGILKDLPCPVQEPETPDVSTGSADGPEQLDLFAMPAQTVQAAPAEKKEPELPEQGTLF